jgi:hypothetical protein
MRIWFTFLLVLWPLASLRAAEKPPPPPSTVSRDDALALAGRYITHVWRPTKKNIFHGVDPDGVRVETPDADFRPRVKTLRPGWWVIGQPNVGVPYKWGGFDLPEDFERGLRAGKYAGDICTPEKRVLLDAAVSQYVVGIDCSGLVSRCWGLPRSYSTRELTNLCDPVKDMKKLLPGDIFNLNNSHVLLFAGWTDPTRTRLRAYEAGSPPSWKVLLNEMPLTFLTDQGYTAWRYRGMKD